MIRSIAPGLVRTWTAIIQSYDGIGESEARMLATRIAGDPELDTMRVTTANDVDDVIDVAGSVIEELDLTGPLAATEDEPALRAELTTTLRADIEQRMTDDGEQDTSVTAQPSRTGALGSTATATESSDTQRPSNAVELYEFIQESELAIDDVEAVLADLKNAEDR
ncbi:hypothetical protein [Haloarchaeobius iranensis]|uniref:Uncharacterized protein n=2 Tax=Haloarchaeobius iranensis TaxID=996166 RepID=A0A1H0A2R8_9EURY|nr:hypothetical protein [Haloarchaeobius iranensis]SDN27858.1 hypothetical protein SAMN05192554_12427 [Haloarchaeobius iranensis]